MDLEITGRGTQVTAKLRTQAEEGLARIQKILGPKCVAKIVLSCEKNRCEAEVTVRNTISDFSSHTSAKDVEVALKDALDKVELQAVKARKKVVTTRHHPDHDATGTIRLQTTNAGEANSVKKAPSQSKTGLGKALAAMDNDETEREEIEAA
ncbi:MAG TPA: HPF/RaiA family ribosome-associated protein [Terriglobus sp.]|jgi:putative sigma-54 modulation protein